MSTSAQRDVAAPAPDRSGSRRWLGLISMSLAQLLVTLDIMVVNIALPSAQADLRFSDSNRAWILTAYTLAFGSLLLVSGRLADRFGRRRMFIVGLAGVAVASAIGGAAGGFGILVAARVVQGAFAALLAPAALALVSTTFPSGPSRARAFGVFGAISMAGGTIGLILGGVLTEILNWRWTMYIGVVFAALAILGATFFIDRDVETKPVRIDLPSVIAVSLGFLGLVYGFTNAGEGSWASPLTIAPLAAGFLLVALFVLRQRRLETPLLPLRLLADRDRAASLIGVFLTMAGLLATVYFSMYFVQGILGWGAILTGIAFIPQPAAVTLASVLIGPPLNRRFGPKIVIPLALVIGALGAGLLTTITPDSRYVATVLPALILVGFGGGLFFPTANALATRGIRPEDIGVGSATVSASQQMGGTLGVAILNTVAALGTASFALTNGVGANSAAAVVDGLVDAFWWAAGIFTLGAIVTAVLLRSTTRRDAAT